MWADARHLRHDDDRRPDARHIHPLHCMVERDFPRLEVLQGIILIHLPLRHRRSSSTSISAGPLKSLPIASLGTSVKNDIDQGFSAMTTVAVLEVQDCMASSAAITHDVLATANRISA